MPELELLFLTFIFLVINIFLCQFMLLPLRDVI